MPERVALEEIPSSLASRYMQVLATASGHLNPDAESIVSAPMKLNAKIGLGNQTHRRETVAEIQMEPRRLELLNPCMP